MMNFNLFKTELSGLIIVERKTIKDHRGFFSRFFCASSFSEIGFETISQINHTQTLTKGTVRGMHFQNPPHAEIKMVSCLKGEVFDVAIDLRKDSPTFLHWHAEILSEKNFKSLIIPKGFAHGFQALTNQCELIYLHSHPYVREAEGALNCQDPKLNISWPIKITELSERDKMHQLIDDDFEGIIL